MRRYLTRRLIQLVPLLMIISFMTFGLMHLAPGGPEQLFLAGEDPSIKAEDIYALREKWGLNDPFPVQYARWAFNVLKGDLGTSYRTKRPVMEEWKLRLPTSIQLNVVVLILTYGLAIPLGVVSAVRQYSKLDYAASTFSFLGFAMPNFWVGLMLIVLVALPSGGAIPTNGYATYGVTVETHGLIAVLLDKSRYMLLPVITLVTGSMAAITRYVRNSMPEVLKEDYVRTARAKGISERTVIYKHAMRNALLPVITISGGFIGALFGGSIVTEQVFAWPGVGQYALAAINTKDHPVVLALLLFGALVGTLSSFITELIYVFVDPRIKYS